MEIINELLPWSSDDELNWNDFLKTETGKRLIPKVLESTPVLLPGGNTNDILVRSGEVRGVQLTIQTLLTLTHAPPQLPVPENAYPSLDVDELWEENNSTVKK